MRYCFVLQIRPDRLEEYRQRHRAVWPEMLAALRDTGWRNYSLHLRGDGLLVGYVECDDLDAAVRAMEATEVNARWQAEMAPFFVDLEGRRPDEGFLVPDAMAFYERHGYQRIENFGHYAGSALSVCYERAIGVGTDRTSGPLVQ